MDTLDAFAAEAAATQQTIAQITDDRWAEPGLGEWTVAELVAHLVRAADRTTAYLEQPVPGDEPVCDRVSYFDFDVAAAGAAVAQRSKDDAARIGTASLGAAFEQAWRLTVEQVEVLGADHLMTTLRGPMHLGEYLGTRVLELTVHHLDLARALGLRASTTDAGLAVTEAILEGLLQGERPDGIDTATFVLAATGREIHPDPRFPLFT